jgi:hypothetical protein
MADESGDGIICVSETVEHARTFVREKTDRWQAPTYTYVPTSLTEGFGEIPLVKWGALPNAVRAP